MEEVNLICDLDHLDSDSDMEEKEIMILQQRKKNKVRSIINQVLKRRKEADVEQSKI